MQKSKLTDFGLCVKTELLRQGMSQAELEKSVSDAAQRAVKSKGAAARRARNLNPFFAALERMC